MTFSQLARVMTTGARIVRDVNAVQRGRIIPRLENRIIGRVAGRVLRKVWR